MSIVSFLQDLGATHLFTLDNSGTSISDDLGNSLAPTNIIDGEYSFVETPTCQGFTHSLQTTQVDDVTTRTDGATLRNSNDINDGGVEEDVSSFDYANKVRTVHLWFQANKLDTPSCIYEQGGGINNFAFIVGTAKAVTWQAADEGQDFMLAQTKFLIEENRNYFLGGTWEHDSQVSGVGNVIGLYVNGVLQERVQTPGATDPFPGHNGDIVIGNTAESLKSYNEDTMPFATRQKNINLLGMYNSVLISAEKQREIFERTVIPTVTIVADTVANQQIALDALSGTSYTGQNCAIRIIQATDATDYRLFVDNITFVQDENLRDIAIQYVGPNTLTLENTNGSNVVEVSTPDEVELDSTTTLVGGGSVVLVEKSHRLNNAGNYSNITANKLVISAVGDYSINTISLDELENVSGGEVNISSTDAISTITNTDGTTNFGVKGTITLKGIVDSSVYISDENGDTVSFAENQTIDKFEQEILSTATEAWTWVISRPGYNKLSGTVNPGDAYLQTISYSQKIDPVNGLPAYGGMKSANLSFAVEGARIIGTLSGDVSAKFFFDQLETYLATESGCSWLGNNPNARIVRLGTDFAGQILTLPNNIAAKSASSGAKKLSAFVISENRFFDRSLFGSVLYNVAETSSEISKAVWRYSPTDSSGAMFEQIAKSKSHALAANLQTQKVEDE